MSFKTGDYVVIDCENEQFKYQGYVCRIIGGQFISTRTQGNHCHIVESTGFNGVQKYLDTSLRAASDSEVLAYRLGAQRVGS